MKKFFFGCLTFCVLAGAVIAVLGYLFLYKPLEATSGDLAAAAEDLRGVIALTERVDSDARFEPPDDGELGRRQVRRFVAVQEATMEAYREHQDELDSGFSRISAGGSASFSVTMGGPGDELRLREAGAAIGELVTTLETVKLAWVDAMHAEGFSIEEYRWVQRTFFKALGKSVVPVDFSGLAEFDPGSLDAWRDLVRGERPDGHVEDVEATGSPGNLKLVEDHQAAADDWLALALLGM